MRRNSKSLSNLWVSVIVGIVASGFIAYLVTWHFSRKGATKEKQVTMHQDMLAINRRREREFEQRLDGLPNAPAAVKGPFELGREAQKHRRWDEAIAHYDSALKEVLSTEQDQQVALYNLIGICHYQAGKLDTALSIMTQSIQLARTISDRPGWAAALYDKGLVLEQQGKRAKAIKTYGEVDSRFGKDTMPGLHVVVAKALRARGYVLIQQGKRVEAIKLSDVLDSRFGKDTTPEIREAVAAALYGKGVALCQQANYDEAIKSFDEIVCRFGKDTVPEIHAGVAIAIGAKGYALIMQGKPEEAVKTLNELDVRFGNDAVPEVRCMVAEGLFNKAGSYLYQQGKLVEAIQGFDELDSRFGNDTMPRIRTAVAMALSNEAAVLSKQGKPEEAIKTYDELVRRFGQDTAPVVKGAVEHAKEKLAERGR